MVGRTTHWAWTCLFVPLLALRPAEGLAQEPGSANGWEGFTGQRWAVVIGISEYQDPGIPDLQFAHRDAEAFATFLTSPKAGLGGIPMDNIRILTDQDASGVQLRTVLYDFLQRPGPDDVVFFFFAGHGMPEPGRPNGTQYLIPADGDRTSFAGSAIRMADVENAVYETRAQVVLFIDACHAGAVGSSGSTRGDELNRINTEFVERMAAVRPGGISMIVAAHEGELAQEGEQWGGGHGVFTYHLLQALEGRGDRDEDGIVDLGEVFEYVRIRVAEDTDNQQNPYTIEELIRADLPIAIVDPGGPVTRTTSTSDSPALDIFESTDLIRERWFSPDSLVAFVGALDTINIRRGTPTGDRIPPTRLRWTSSSPEVAEVDEFGVLTPRASGVSTIQVSVFTRDTTILVRVFEPPERVAFDPAATDVVVSQFDEIRFSGALELPGGETVGGVQPTLVLGDTSVLAPRGSGRYVAIRQGSATVTGSLGPERQTWQVTVMPPRLKIDHDQYGALRLGSELPLVAHFVRPDGSAITEATSVTWQSSDTSVTRPTTSGLRTTGLGRSVLRASVASARDSIEIFVLGDLLVASESSRGPRISTVDLTNSRVIPLLDDEAGGRSPALSPDGRTIAFVSSREPSHPRIWLMDADGSNVRRLTEERSGVFGLPIPFYQEHSPVWSVTGDRVYFLSNSAGSYDVYSIHPDGSGLERVTRSGAHEGRVSVAPDGGRIAFDRAAGAGNTDVWLALPDGAESVGAVQDTWDEARPVLLPDNQMLLAETPRDYRRGEALALYDVVSGRKIREIVPAKRDHYILFAVSSEGDRIAYAQLPRLGSGEPVVVISDFDGVVLTSVSLGQDERVLDISWGPRIDIERQGG